MVKKTKKKSRKPNLADIKRREEEEDTVTQNLLVEAIISLLNFYKDTRRDQKANWTPEHWEESNFDQEKWEESENYFQKCEQMLVKLDSSPPEKKTIEQLNSLLKKIIKPRLEKLGVDFTPQAAFKSKSKKSKSIKRRKSPLNRKKL